MSDEAPPPVEDVAAIDVGSNSVRLVVYRLEGRAIWTVYNEKVLAGLGRDLPRTGRLSAAGVEEALGALRRFAAVLEGVRPARVFTAATAAVREAADRDAFIARVQQESGLKLRVLSGEEEARLAAEGVLAGDPAAEGVVGDLGGSSLELVRLAGGRPGGGVTLPMGPFALGAPARLDHPAVLKRATAALTPLAGRFSAPVFHAVGGAWRNLALVHMKIIRYPLQVVHQYEMTSDEALATARLLARQSKASLERIPGVSRKRAETLPYAAMMLEALVGALKVERVSLSSYGVREGLIADAMAAGVRRQDPLVAGCEALGLRHAANERLGPALEAWLRPLWSRLEPVFARPRDATLLAAACRLADLGARLHPDHRAALAFDQVLRAPIAGQTHAERAFLASAIFARYTAAAPPPERIAGRLLTPERFARARALGAAMRLGSDLSGRSADLLQAAALSRDGARLVLDLRPGRSELVQGEQVVKRAQTLALALGLELKVRAL